MVQFTTENAKHAIDALSRPAETKSANKWLTEFELQVEAWKIADELMQDPHNTTYRLFGARLLHTKIRKDFSQIDTALANGLMTCLTTRLLEQANRPSQESSVSRYIALSIAALALQLNTPGVVHQLFTALNPLVRTQPKLLLELLLVLPEECYDRAVDVDKNIRDQFSQQLCQSAPEVLSFLMTLRNTFSAFGTETEIPLLKCLERWVYNIDIPFEYLSTHPVFQYALDCLTQPPLVEEAVELWISVTRKYCNQRELWGKIFPLLHPRLEAVWKQQQGELSKRNGVVSEDDDDDDVVNMCRNVTRLFVDMAETAMVFLLEILMGVGAATSATNHTESIAYIHHLFSQLLQCCAFRYSVSVSRMPLKFFYDVAEFSVDTDYRSDVTEAQKESLRSFLQQVFHQLLPHILYHLSLSTKQNVHTNVWNTFHELVDNEYRDWMDAIIDCCTMLKGEIVLQEISQWIQTEGPGGSSKTGTSDVHRWFGGLCALREVVRRVSPQESHIMPSLLQHLVSPSMNTPLFTTLIVEIVGNTEVWLRSHHDMIPPLWKYLVDHIADPHCSQKSCKALLQFMQISQFSGIRLPIFELYTTLMSIRSGAGLKLKGELLLLEGICVVLSRQLHQAVQQDHDIAVAIAQFREGFQQLIRPMIQTMQQLTAGSMDAESIHQEISRMTVIVEHMQLVVPLREVEQAAAGGRAAVVPVPVAVHPVMEYFSVLQPLLTTIMTTITSEKICEHVCRLYKYIIRASTRIHLLPSGAAGRLLWFNALGFVQYFDSMGQYCLQLLRGKFYSCFVYLIAVLVGELAPLTHWLDSSTAVVPRPSEQELDSLLQKVFELIWSVSEVFFQHMKQVEDFQNYPDVVEEYYFLLAKTIQLCPNEFVQRSITQDFNPTRVISLIQASLVGLKLEHREAQKGILLFLQQYVHSVRKAPHYTAKRELSFGNMEMQSKKVQLAHEIAIKNLAPVLVTLVIHSVGQPVERTAAPKSTTAVTNDSAMALLAFDEEHGSVVDLLWAVRMLIGDQIFQECVAQAVNTMTSSYAKEIATRKLRFPTSLIRNEKTNEIVNERAFVDLLHTYHKLCKKMT